MSTQHAQQTREIMKASTKHDALPAGTSSDIRIDESVIRAPLVFCPTTCARTARCTEIRDFRFAPACNDSTQVQAALVKVAERWAERC